MNKPFIIFLGLIVAVKALFAQDKIAGQYHPAYHAFISRDTNVLTASFNSPEQCLIPFVLKDKDLYGDGTRVGFIDTTGRILIKPVYANCSKFIGEYAVAQLKKNGKLGIIDNSGNIVLPFVYDNLSLCNNGLFVVHDSNKMAFLKPDGKVVVPFGGYAGVAGPVDFERSRPDDHDGEYRPNEIRTGKNWWWLLQFDSVKFKRYLGVYAGNKWAVIDSTGKEVVVPKFEEIGVFQPGDLALVKLDGKWGVTNASGQIVVAAQYDKITIFSPTLFRVSISNKSGLLSLDNKLLIPIKYLVLTMLDTNSFLIYDNGAYGVINQQNKIIIPTTHGNVKKFGTGYVASEGTGEALYDGSGKRLSDFIGNGSVYSYPVWGNENYGYFVQNVSTGTFTHYDKIAEYSGSFYAHQIFYYRDKKWGFMNLQGEEVTPPIYDRFKADGMKGPSGANISFVIAKKNNKWGVLGEWGKVLLKFDYDTIWPNRDVLVVKQGKLSGFISNQFKKITPVMYDSLAVIYDFINNPKPIRYFLCAEKNNKWAGISRNGKPYTPFKYDEPLFFINGVAVAKVNGKYGLVNDKGRALSTFIYDEITDVGFYMSNKIMLIKKNGKLGLIDSTGHVMAKPAYDNISPLSNYFGNGYQVILNNRIGFLNAKGAMVIPCIYNSLDFDSSYPHLPYIIAVKNGRAGLLTHDGHVALSFIYDRIAVNTTTDEYYYEITLNGKKMPFKKRSTDHKKG